MVFLYIDRFNGSMFHFIIALFLYHLPTFYFASIVCARFPQKNSRAKFSYQNILISTKDGDSVF